MAIDKNGNLVPLMLSNLVEAATRALKDYGDMPVGVWTQVPGYEYNEEHDLPASGDPGVRSPKWTKSYWRGRFDKAFCIDGG